ncbi:anthranilate synthase component I [Desertibaculum subflavum]|uniref:anthranilate synthase component I n=1 Tax=Desertibaculum subflavum TaxID=2268458 RepID=UPI000E67370A
MTAVSRYLTEGGIRVTRHAYELTDQASLLTLTDSLDGRRGAIFRCAVDYPGRYARWTVAYVDPPLEISARGYRFEVLALNGRGKVLIGAVAAALRGNAHLAVESQDDECLTGQVIPSSESFTEEERSRQPSVFSVVRSVLDLFRSDEDRHLGLYGAFGYDVLHQFEPIPLAKERPSDQRDVVLHLPDRIYVIEKGSDRLQRFDYEFETASGSTVALDRRTATITPNAQATPAVEADLPPGGYAAIVREAMPFFAKGELFEVVPSFSSYRKTAARPCELYRTLSAVNPSPFGFLVNLGGEHLIGASPEMFVRVTGRRVETCPISGTIRRGRDALEDADRIKELLNSVKDECELTMCTDVDRNDKARICDPGTVKVIGRRQIEMYSHLIHTVDHVEGRLKPERDSIDAFLSHCWAVTVTGAPKPWAARFIEQREKTTRRWYGGAVGRLTFDGECDTGLTLRTIRLAHGIAEMRAGATLLVDSDPDAEEQECRVKIAALLETLKRAEEAMSGRAPAGIAPPPPAGRGMRLLLIDYEDSFVHMLGDCFRRQGAEVVTIRHNHAEAALEQDWSMVVLSPGPGNPTDFAIPAMIAKIRARNLPIFGVCLGLQGLVEHYGGTLGQLDIPRHGKPSGIEVVEGETRLFTDLPARFTAGRYHSLYAVPEKLPAAFRVTARSDDGVIMAIEHASEPVAAVQFHPESIMTASGDVGPNVVANVLRTIARKSLAEAAE